MALTLFSNANNPNAFKALIAAEYVGIGIVLNDSNEYANLSPIGKFPVLKTPDVVIFESNAIARYVARLDLDGFYGSSATDMALIDQWIDFSSNELGDPLSKWGNGLLGFRPRIAEVEKEAISNAHRGLAALNSHLASNTYLVGHEVTLADVVTVCNLLNGFKYLLSAKLMSEYPHVQRYFLTLVNQPNFKKVIGEVVQFSEDKKEVEVKPVAAPPAPVITEEKPSEPKQAKAKQEKKKEAKTEKKPTEEPFDDDEDSLPKPKPEKSPLDLLPPSPMVLDAWKRLYSNTKANNFREVAIKGFWDMYDPEGYSLWFCDYKFNEENNVQFVTMNKVSGFLQRMEVVRKHGFAKMCILGDNPPFVVKGVWLFRGPDVPQVVIEECYDSELYSWTKVDISDEAQKELVNAYFEEPDVVAGLTLVEAKCFK